MKQRTLYTLFIIFLFVTSYAQQWESVPNLPSTEFTAIATLGNKLYAASGKKLYKSANGVNWTIENISTTPIIPTCISIFNSVLYVGTMNSGLFYRNLAPSSAWNNALPGIHVSNFMVHNGDLFLCGDGFGVWKRTVGNWTNITYNLPTYSYNVSKILSFNGKLFAFAGGNGTFYTLDFNTNLWKEDYYRAGYSPGLYINDVMLSGNTLFAASGYRLFLTEDSGENWVTDSNGLINGSNRILHSTSNNLYVLTLNPNSNTTHFQKRNTIAPAQSNWGNYNEQLPFYSYAMTTFNGRMYIASLQGVYTKADLSLGLENPVDISQVIIYPSPSIDGVIHLKSDNPIEKIEAFDSNGRKIVTKETNAFNESISINGHGVFLIKLLINGQNIIKKVIVR